MTGCVSSEGEQSTETIDEESAYVTTLSCLKVVQKQSAVLHHLPDPPHP